MFTRAETVGAGVGEGLWESEPSQPGPENGRLPECGVCFEEFSDEGPHIPLNLNCGHSYCTGRYYVNFHSSSPVTSSFAFHTSVSAVPTWQFTAIGKKFAKIFNK